MIFGRSEEETISSNISIIHIAFFFQLQLHNLLKHLQRKFMMWVDLFIKNSSLILRVLEYQCMSLLLS